MKVTTEKLPKSLLALDIELDKAQVEKGLDRAARRISQKYAIPGFRKGKAPRFIVENYFGRSSLIEEASNDLINRSFREALEHEKITPVGQASVDTVNFEEEPFSLRVLVPVAPTVTLPDYRSITTSAETKDVTDEMVQQAMDARREEHVVLQEIEEPRPAAEGDQLVVTMETFVDGESLEQYEEGEDIPESTLVLEPGRLVAGLYDGLLGMTPDETREIVVTMPDDHENEQVRGKDVTFKVKLLRIQERILPEWDELPVLDEFEGTVDELRAKTREDLLTTARENAERDIVNSYVEALVQQTEYDLPDALIEQEADRLLHEQGQQFERYGITLDQMLQYRNQTHDEAVEELKPQGEEQLKRNLVLGELARREQLSIEDGEIDAEVGRMVENYPEEEREVARNVLSSQLRSSVANEVLNQKLRQRLLAIATGTAPELTQAPSTNADDADGAATTDESTASEPATTEDA